MMNTNNTSKQYGPYKPFILKCPTGKFVWRGSIPLDLACNADESYRVFDTHQEAVEAVEAGVLFGVSE